jgi:SpoVK/Ycf46/Vps4 family AAA+-type ATPase
MKTTKPSATKPATLAPAQRPTKALAAALASSRASVIEAPLLDEQSALDLMCTQFVLGLVVRMGSKFNLRRDINTLLSFTARHLCWPRQALTSIQAYCARRCAESPAWEGAGDLSLEAFVQKHGLWKGSFDDATLFYYLDEYVKDAPKDILQVFATTSDVIATRLKREKVLVKDNISLLGNVLQLNEAERSLLLFGALTRYQRDMRTVLLEFKVSNALEAYAAFAQLTGANSNEIAEAMRPGSRLERIGLIENLIAETNFTDLADLMKVSDKLLPVLLREYRNEGELMAVFTRPAKPSELSMADFKHVGDDVRYLTALLTQATKSKAEGVNMLVYGEPGTGKTELAKVMAAAAGCELYEVECADRDGNSLSGKDRYRSLQVALAFLRGRKNVALLFDEVEDVFPPAAPEIMNLFQRDDARGSVNGKAWVNQILETNPVPTIWITNSIGQIDPAFRRRFQYHLHLKTPPAGAREGIVRKHLDKLEVSDAFVAKLSERKELTPAQIRSAARFAQLTAPQMADDNIEALIERQLRNADSALGKTGETDGARKIVTNYDLTLLNVETRFELPRIIEALKKKGAGCLCFYGPPGTGKTALAEHIAKSIDKPLIIRRASDLVSKFVGETEQNMAAMFRDAEDQQAVLLLDEADSFLRSRGMAQRSYEVTEVNEMLQGMERFKGVFICTTNLFDQLDEAALRRFTFKIQFKPLTREQRERMFIAEALNGDATQLTQALVSRLNQMSVLAPGDFAAVKRQVDLLGEDALDAEAFLDQLEREHKVKPEVREQRGMGFVN